MFLKYYGLREQPFGVTPDPRHLYLSQTHREALASLAYGVESGRGFMALVAMPGMGKTTLLFQLLEWLRNSAQTVLLFQTQCDSREFFRYLLAGLGFDTREHDVVVLHKQFNEVLIRAMHAGKRFVLVIDEAQNLDDSVLETIRLLSNFETPRAKLMQIILAGQPQLAEKLARPALAQLRQRISMLIRLNPLTPGETAVCIEHRLRLAGYGGGPLFTPEALALIAVRSEGIPRNIVNLCFNVLSLGCALERRIIDEGIVREVLSDLDVSTLLPRPPGSSRPSDPLTPGRPPDSASPRGNGEARSEPKLEINVSEIVREVLVGLEAKSVAAEPQNAPPLAATISAPPENFLKTHADLNATPFVVEDPATPVAASVTSTGSEKSQQRASHLDVAAAVVESAAEAPVEVSPDSTPLAELPVEPAAKRDIRSAASSGVVAAANPLIVHKVPSNSGNVPVLKGARTTAQPRAALKTDPTRLRTTPAPPMRASRSASSATGLRNWWVELFRPGRRLRKVWWAPVLGSVLLMGSWLAYPPGGAPERKEPPRTESGFALEVKELVPAESSIAEVRGLSTEEIVSVVVRPLQTLSQLSVSYLGRYDGETLRKIRDLNPELLNPDDIKVGQIIRFPRVSEPATPPQVKEKQEEESQTLSKKEP